jgi:hypothetical protein
LRIVALLANYSAYFISQQLPGIKEILGKHANRDLQNENAGEQ